MRLRTFGTRGSGDTSLRGRSCGRSSAFDTEEPLEGKDDDIVVVVGLLRGTVRLSGAPVEQRIGLVYELRDRKIRYCRAYRDPQDALAAAGLGDEADAAKADEQKLVRRPD
jgi:hypothetical protein